MTGTSAGKRGQGAIRLFATGSAALAPPAAAIPAGKECDSIALAGLFWISMIDLARGRIRAA
jgi:hypothetical protein